MSRRENGKVECTITIQVVSYPPDELAPEPTLTAHVTDDSQRAGESRDALVLAGLMMAQWIVKNRVAERPRVQ